MAQQTNNNAGWPCPRFLLYVSECRFVWRHLPFPLNLNSFFLSTFHCSTPIPLSQRSSSSCQLIASLVYIFLITTFIKLTWLLLCLRAHRHTHTHSREERGEAKCTDFTTERRRQAICSFWHFFRVATVFDSFLSLSLSLHPILLFDFKYRFFCFDERLYRHNKHNMKRERKNSNRETINIENTRLWVGC